jgi:hypothetical protein
MITIERTPAGWAADFRLAPDGEAVWRLFGTYVIPTAFTGQAGAEYVKRELEVLNPGVTVRVKA